MCIPFLADQLIVICSQGKVFKTIFCFRICLCEADEATFSARQGPLRILHKDPNRRLRSLKVIDRSWDHVSPLGSWIMTWLALEAWDHRSFWPLKRPSRSQRLMKHEKVLVSGTLVALTAQVLWSWKTKDLIQPSRKTPSIRSTTLGPGQDTLTHSLLPLQGCFVHVPCIGKKFK